MKKTIAIITSDPHSINYEIIKKSLFFFKKKNKNNYLFIGSKDLLKKNSIDISLLEVVDIEWDKNNKKKYLKKSFEKFINLYNSKKVHALINLPLSKKDIFGNSFPGVTEYISNKFMCTGKETMLLYNELFSVSPLTTHIKIKDISINIKIKKIINNFQNILNFYKKTIGIKNPLIGILGLNPHNAVDTYSNSEEQKIIIPSIKKLKTKFKKNIIGPISPDTSFIKRQDEKVNSLIGMYHDQVLTTFKYINKFSAINITLGLPFIRMSPDHGTASDIIGKNKANPESFLYCLNFFEKFHKSI